MHLPNLVHRLVLLLRSLLGSGVSIIACRSRPILLAVPHLIQIGALVAAFRLSGRGEAMGCNSLGLIAVFLVIAGLRGVLGGLSHESVKVGQVDLRADKVIDFGRFVVLDRLHVVLLLLLCIAVRRFFLQTCRLGARLRVGRLTAFSSFVIF